MGKIAPKHGSGFDVIVVGSGAGGCATAHGLVSAGLSVLLLEKGRGLPRDGQTMDVDRVVRQGQFKSREMWRTREGKTLAPEEYFNIGGKTKWYGAALARFAPEEFEALPAYHCPAWPFAYEVLAPYYDEAEKLLGLTSFPAESGLNAIIDGIRAKDNRWQAQPLPMGLSPDILAHPAEASRFDGFALASGRKADAERVFLEPMLGRPNLTMVSGAEVVGLLAHAGITSKPTRIAGVRLADGRTAESQVVVLAAGALHSPRLLQRYLDEHDLGRLALAAALGRNFKLHVLTAVLGVSASTQNDLLRKTTLLTHEAAPHSSVQALGFDAELLARLIPAFVPRALARSIGGRAYGFFLQTEDGSHPGNRVVDAGCEGNPHGVEPLLDYDKRRLPAAVLEHRRLVSMFRRALARIGYLSFARSIGLEGTAHACGTMLAGNDPFASVTDANGRVHGMEGLYVADGSVLARISRVNPALTIYAWGLKVAHQLTDVLAKTNTTAVTTLETPQ